MSQQLGQTDWNPKDQQRPAAATEQQKLLEQTQLKSKWDRVKVGPRATGRQAGKQPFTNRKAWHSISRKAVSMTG